MSLTKFIYIRSKKARRSARDEECTMNSPNCNYNPETTVLCHSNKQEHGAGWSIKASDEFSFYGCSGCNLWFDSMSAPKGEKERLYQKAWKKTQVLFKEKGLTEVVLEDI